jgi:hypothetical protein
MVTDPPADYLSHFTDKELYDLWETRTARLKKVVEEDIKATILWEHEHTFLHESIDRVEKEMAKRSLPVPGEDTFHE